MRFAERFGVIFESGTCTYIPADLHPNFFVRVVFDTILCSPALMPRPGCRERSARTDCDVALSLLHSSSRALASYSVVIRVHVRSFHCGVDQHIPS